MQVVKLVLWVGCISALMLLVGAACGADPTWSVQAAPDGQSLVLRPLVPGGKYTIRANSGAFGGMLVLVGADGAPQILDWVGTITYGGTPLPTPTPGPTPGPTPQPEPKPVPTPGPIYCLMVYESADLVKLPIAQSSIVTSKPIRDYLASHAAKGPSGPEFRFLDKDSDPSKMPPNLKAWFSDAAAAFKASGKPQIVITNGKDTFKGEWPATVDAMLQLLQQYGGK